MIITNTNMKMDATHDLDIRHQESVLRRITARRPSQEDQGRENDSVGAGGNRALGPLANGGLRVTLSQSANFQYSEHSIESYGATTVSEDSDKPTSKNEADLWVLLKTMEKITGKSFHFSKIQFAPASDAAPIAAPTTAEGSPAQSPTPVTAEAVPAANNAAPQIETITASTHYESERTRFSASGVITTADGREIEIGVQLNMSRQFYEANVDRRLETQALTDPLVINWVGSGAELTEEQYAFDLNSDGTTEQVSFIRPEQGGFLAYDRNRDGTINSGGELFGPTQGDGFSELSAYDQDANGWIDEADAIYHDLSIWSKKADGTDQLVALADTGIGAIYLRAVDTPFSVTTDTNEQLGQVRRSSVYLNENGSAGVIQQVDLVE